jgi:hypothetical protein
LREANTRNKTLKEPITQRSKPVLKQASGKANTWRSKHQEKQTYGEANTRRSKPGEANTERIKHSKKQRERSKPVQITEASIEKSKH